LDGSKKESFDKAMELFVVLDDVHNHNKHCLRSMDHSIACNNVVAVMHAMDILDDMNIYLFGWFQERVI